MATCPKCRRSYTETHTLCPDDGEVLIPDKLLEGAIDRELKRGETVGEYVIEGKLGQGTFGDVYRGIQPLIGKQVAVKILSQKYSADPTIVSRFIAEARAVNQIRHRNIIDIFSFGQLQDGRHYHIMELLSGKPLDEHLREKRRLSLVEALLILRPIGRALDAAHAAGIAHRDLKPANIFLAKDEDGQPFPKLLDFGIAKLLTDNVPRAHQTATGLAVGTPDYMSPEQCQGAEVDHRTDVYAFGVMAYQLLTGVLPFKGENVVDVLVKQMTAQPVPPSRMANDLPAALDAPILWMMEKDKTARPSDLATAVAALESAANASGHSLPRAAQTVDPSQTPAVVPRMPASFSQSASTVSGHGMPLSDPALGQTLPSEARGITASIPGQGRRMRFFVAGAVGLSAVLGFSVFALRHGEEAVVTPLEISDPAADKARAPLKEEAPRKEDKVEDASAEAPPQVVKLVVTASPRETQILGPGGLLLGKGPGTIELPRGSSAIRLEFRAPGYQTQSKEIVPIADGAVSVSLKKHAARPAKKGKKAGIDDIESFD